MPREDRNYLYSGKSNRAPVTRGHVEALNGQAPSLSRSSTKDARKGTERLRGKVKLSNWAGRKSDVSLGPASERKIFSKIRLGADSRGGTARRRDNRRPRGAGWCKHADPRGALAMACLLKPPNSMRPTGRSSPSKWSGSQISVGVVGGTVCDEDEFAGRVTPRCMSLRSRSECASLQFRNPRGQTYFQVIPDGPDSSNSSAGPLNFSRTLTSVGNQAAKRRAKSGTLSTRDTRSTAASSALVAAVRFRSRRRLAPAGVVDRRGVAQQFTEDVVDEIAEDFPSLVRVDGPGGDDLGSFFGKKDRHFIAGLLRCLELDVSSRLSVR